MLSRFRCTIFLCCSALIGQSAHAQAPRSPQSKSSQDSARPGRQQIETEKSRVKARCFMPGIMSACELACEVENTGKVAAKDVVIGFDATLPVETHIAAPPDERIDLKEI